MTCVRSRRLVPVIVLCILTLVAGVTSAATNTQSASATFRTHSTDWERNLGWCYHSSAQLFIGDFNGDGRDDMLCHDTDSGYKWVALANRRGQFTGTTWEGNLGWCYHASAKLYIGDFNGDGRDDMLCSDGAGYKWIAYAKGNGRFTGTDWEANLAWCYHASAKLYIGDVNGDGRDDMLCSDGAGYKWIAYAKAGGRFTGTDWEANLGWCYHSGAELHIGDFNRDGRDDMLCSDSEGHKWVAVANQQGRFTGTTWEGNLGWCYHASAELYIGDYNRDGRDDMLCSDGAGYKWVAYAKGNGRFTGTDWEANMGWCHHSGAELYIGDFNRDRRDDMLCHDTNTGYKWISYSDL